MGGKISDAESKAKEEDAVGGKHETMTQTAHNATIIKRLFTTLRQDIKQPVTNMESD
jgi:hypothetical protein